MAEDAGGPPTADRDFSDEESAVEFLRSLLSAVPAVITRIDAEYRIRFFNRVEHGFDLQQLLGRNVVDVIAPEYQAIARETFQRVQRTGVPDSYEATPIGPDGTTAHYVNYVSPIRDADGSTGLCLASVDVTADRERQRSLEESREKLALAVAATRMGMWDMDLVTGKVVWDARMHEITATDQPLGLAEFTELVHPDDRASIMPKLNDAIEAGSIQNSTARIVLPDGSVRWTSTSGVVRRDADGRPVRFTGGMLDITDQKSTEEQLRRAQKVQAVGDLSAGIAHNFNNMLMILLPSLELIADAVPAPQREFLEDARVAAQRAADMVRQLMTYAGQPRRSGGRRRVSLPDLVQQCVEMCQRTFDRSIEWAVHQEPVPAVAGDGGEIQQVLMNILLNARDALAARSEGPEICVEVRTIETTSPSGDLREWVVIRIRDNGHGMPPDVREQIFEPFFTTKASEGTGLGLATSDAIMRDHGGWIDCESVPSQGTTFSVYLQPSEES